MELLTTGLYLAEAVENETSSLSLTLHRQRFIKNYK